MGVFGNIGNAINTVRQSTTDTFNQARSQVDQTIDRNVSNIQRSVDRNISNVQQSVDQTVDETVEQAQETSQNVGSSVDNIVQRSQETVDQTVDETVEQAQETSESIWSSIGETVDQAAEQSQETVDRTVDQAVEQTQETSQNVGSEINRSVDQAVEQTQETVDQAVDQSRQNVVTAITNARNRAQGQDQQDQGQTQKGDWERFDDRVARNTEFLLDNPNASIQEGSQSLLQQVTGAESDEELGQQFQAADEGITRSIDRAIADTPLDNPGTSLLRTGFDTFITDGLRVGIGAGTGINTQTGSTEARTGAMEALDIGLTAGTAGAGRAATTAGRSLFGGSDDVFSLRRADETGDTAQAATRSADESLPTTTTTTPTTTTTRSASEATDATTTSVVRSSDDLPSTSTRASDQAAGTGRSGRTSGASRATTEGRDVIDIGSATSRSTRAADEAATASRSDTLAGRIRQTLRSATPSSRRGRIAATAGGGAAALVGGGAIVDSLQDRYETAGGLVLTKTDTFPPTEVFQGGVVYQVQENGSSAGYSVILAQTESGELIGLDENGEPFTMRLSTSDLRELAGGGSGGGA